MSKTQVLAPVAGRAVPLRDVPDPVFSQGMVGYGAAIDPPRGVIEAVAPVSGKLLKLMPHAYIVHDARQRRRARPPGPGHRRAERRRVHDARQPGRRRHRGPGRHHLRRPADRGQGAQSHCRPLSSWTNANPRTSFRPKRSTPARTSNPGQTSSLRTSRWKSSSWPTPRRSAASRQTRSARCSIASRTRSSASPPDHRRWRSTTNWPRAAMPG